MAMTKPQVDMMPPVSSAVILSCYSNQFMLSTSGYASGEKALMTNNSITLTPGTWEVYGMGIKIGSGIENSHHFYFGIYTANGDNASAVSSTNLVVPTFGYNTLLTVSRSGSGADFNATITTPPFIITVTTNTPIYGVSGCSFTTAGNGQFYTQLYARRVA